VKYVAVKKQQLQYYDYSEGPVQHHNSLKVKLIRKTINYLLLGDDASFLDGTDDAGLELLNFVGEIGVLFFHLTWRIYNYRIVNRKEKSRNSHKKYNYHNNNHHNHDANRTITHSHQSNRITKVFLNYNKLKVQT